MIEIYLLEQLDALARYGTLVAASEALHLTQPTLTRSMQKLETQAGVPLFIRESKRISLNENGKAAAVYARRILDLEREMQEHLQFLEHSRTTLTFGAVSPGPLLEVSALIAESGSWHNVSAEVNDAQALLAGLQKEKYQFVILSDPPEDSTLRVLPLGSEQLYYGFVPSEEFPEDISGVWFHEIDGQTILSPTKVGIWSDIVRRMMPRTHLISQDENTDLNEIARSSNMPIFASDIGIRIGVTRPNHVCVPILDPEATLSFYLVYGRQNEKALRPVLSRLKKD